nr:DUF418 domain-containing protein [Paenibacillus sp. BC26]
MHNITGYAGGLGWAALIGLISVYPRGIIVSKLTMAIAALGQRSLSFYLFQSIVFYIVFSERIGGLGASADQLGSDIVAWLTWFISILMAIFMQRANYAGPAEKLLRRLSNKNT